MYRGECPTPEITALSHRAVVSYLEERRLIGSNFKLFLNTRCWEFVATRCVLSCTRHVNASECVCGRDSALGVYTPRPLSYPDVRCPICQGHLSERFRAKIGLSTTSNEISRLSLYGFSFLHEVYVCLCMDC